MNRFTTFTARAALCGALVLAGASVQAQTYTKQQLQETYSQHLASEGYRPELTPSGNVKFRREGRTYLIYADERDPTYFRMTLSFSAEDKSPAMRAKRLEGCNYATFTTKVVKAYLDNDGDPTFSAEMFLVVPGDFKNSLGRLFSAIDNAYDKYTSKLSN